eukprot:GGOE01020849.1.p2 GENE.GGOE01020849.1~~GGOE01020849.1.p2  ORF type:complete len:106 (+),score=2.91 GGOE01020849.1:27-344(+)
MAASTTGQHRVCRWAMATNANPMQNINVDDSSNDDANDESSLALWKQSATFQYRQPTELSMQMPLECFRRGFTLEQVHRPSEERALQELVTLTCRARFPSRLATS